MRRVLGRLRLRSRDDTPLPCLDHLPSRALGLRAIGHPPGTREVGKRRKLTLTLAQRPGALASTDAAG